ncbi:hypothetical protein [Methanogenium sp. S4BF]|nr:hypothetical protein [Methanogenium sp. S4BF]
MRRFLLILTALIKTPSECLTYATTLLSSATVTLSLSPMLRLI